MNGVIDASVTIKWFIPDGEVEEDADKTVQQTCQQSILLLDIL